MIWCIWFLVKKFYKNTQNLPHLPPGPKGLPFVGNLPFLHLQLQKYFTTLAQTYGPIISLHLGYKLVVIISSPSLASEILKDQDIMFANRDVSIAGKVGFYDGSDILWSPYGPEWRMLRRVCVQELLSGPMLDSTYVLRQNEVRRMVNNLYVRGMSLVNVGEEVFITMISLITNMLCGGGGGNEEENKSLVNGLGLVVKEMIVLLGKPNISDFFPSLTYFDLQGIEKEMKRLVQKFDNIFELMVNERTRKDHEKNNKLRKKDFLQSLLNIRDIGDAKTPLTITQAKALLMDMIVGGTGTTSYTMEFALAEMMNNPQVMERAQQELEVVVGANNMVVESHIHQLPYLKAIMKETLRLHPIAPLLAPRCPSESCIVGGYSIPKGTRVCVNVWANHRDPFIWEDPLKFDPKSFMGSKWDFNGNDFKYFPFGSGRRICVGIELAERMFVLMLASLVHGFEWKVSNDEKLNLEEKFGIGLRKKKPLMAIPTPRIFNQTLYE
ncbi:flavonoid 3'-monooxygenase-like [Impatiens glandulifera]|uniref:flavonoid 3'-monooxygenase-like n=1 Tax=Impatiens glandulifera TaxID=253017 RepID=UPI001FB1870C|nr:flavonoid 3'-monooxygenase-like [Impatiens glandulifera]